MRDRVLLKSDLRDAESELNVKCPTCITSIVLQYSEIVCHKTVRDMNFARASERFFEALKTAHVFGVGFQTPVPAAAAFVSLQTFCVRYAIGQKCLHVCLECGVQARAATNPRLVSTPSDPNEQAT